MPPASEEKLYSETEFKQKLLEEEVKYIKKSHQQHMKDEGEQWQKQNAKLDNVEDMCRRFPDQMVTCRDNMEKDLRGEFISRSEVEQMEARLDNRIDEVPKVVGAQIQTMTTNLKANHETTVNAALKRIMVYIGIGFGAAVAILSLVIKITGS